MPIPKISIKYTEELDCSIPPKSICGPAAKMLGYMMMSIHDDPLIVNRLVADETFIDGFLERAEKYFDEDADFTGTELSSMYAKASIPATLVAKLLLSHLKEDVFFDAYQAHPYDMLDYMHQVSAKKMLGAIAEHGIIGVGVPILKVMQISGYHMQDEGRAMIDDDIVYGFLCSYYSSFDERFQMAFYPGAYRNYASSHAPQFEFSAFVSQMAAESDQPFVSATSAWIKMLASENSLLSDFFHKSNRPTGVKHSINDSLNNASVSEMCHHYLHRFGGVPQRTSIGELVTQQTVELIVADSMNRFSPAAMSEVVYSLMRNNGESEDTIQDWAEYIRIVESYMEPPEDGTVAHPAYPTRVVLDDTAQELIISLFSERDDLRLGIASAAFAKFLDLALDEETRDNIVLSATDIANGYMMLGETVGTPSLTDADAEILSCATLLSNYDVPDVFQGIFLAHMMRANRSLVNIDDVQSVAIPDQTPSELLTLAAGIDPADVHAGLDPETTEVLSAAQAMFRRSIVTTPLDPDNAVRMYASFLAVAVAAHAAHKVDPESEDKLIPEEDCWISAMVPLPFDPRSSIFFKSGGGRMASNESGTMPTAFVAVGSLDPVTRTFQPVEQTRTAVMRGIVQSASNPMKAFCTDMVEEARNGNIGQSIVGRDGVITLAETVLTRRDKSNPLLLAPAGAGKTAIVEAIAKRLADGTSALPENTGLCSLELSKLIGDGCAPGVMADRLEQVLKYAVENNIILFIDEVHMIVSVGNGEFNVANVLKPMMARGGLKLIGATTEREYNYTIAKDRALERRFSPMHLPALKFNEIVSIVKNKQAIYGDYHKVAYADRVPELIALMADEYMSNRESPDRELDILDTAASLASCDGTKVVSDAHVVKAISLLTSNTGIKTHAEIAQELKRDNYSREYLDSVFPNVAGQYKAKEDIMRQIMKSKLGLSVRDKPKNIFLFTGAAGVGKTYMASEMAALLELNRKSDVYRINMAEFKDHTTTKLLGANPQFVGYQEGGILTNFMKSHPNGIVILDEFEKAHKSIQELFLNMFSEGFVTAGDGFVVDCRSITFVCTSNIGADQYHHNRVGLVVGSEKDRKADESADLRAELSNRLGEPLMSRIDALVVFEKLNDEELIDLCRITYRKFSDRARDFYGADVEQTVSEEKAVESFRGMLPEFPENKRDIREIIRRLEDEVLPKAEELL